MNTNQTLTQFSAIIQKVSLLWSNMKTRVVILASLALLIGLMTSFFIVAKPDSRSALFSTPGQILNDLEIGDVDTKSAAANHPLKVENLRAGRYPGSQIVIEETLTPGSNYQRYIASYQSEGNKIFALLTVPNQTKPATGWPVIIFNHGYIPPDQYVTTERYVAYTDAFSRNGYIVLRSDYRGHGNSEGVARGGYGTDDYTIDVLNAVGSIKQFPDADPTRIGMWGHSMGGHVTLRSMVASKDIKAGVIWAGVVASYPDLLNNWRRGSGTPTPLPSPLASAARRWRQALTEQYGTPEQNPTFWDSISANSFLSDISGPLQLHHGTDDTSVPVEFSEKLASQMQTAGKPVEIYLYPDDDHDITSNFATAMQRSVAFFDAHVKGESNL